MCTYGKIVDNDIEFAPENIVYKGNVYAPATEEVLQLCGYKKVVLTEMPRELVEDKHYEGKWEESEDTLTYTYELVDDDRLTKIATRKQKLFDTDYCVIKIAEGVATQEEYADIISQRAIWRSEINELESEA